MGFPPFSLSPDPPDLLDARHKNRKTENASRGAVRTNLYSVTEYFTPSRGWSETGLPAVFFLYDLSPVVMEVSDAPASFGHFLARVCAVVGGVFAVTGMTDRWIHRAVEVIAAKRK